MSDRSFRLSFLILIIFLALVASLLVYNSINDYQQYYHFQEANAKTMANGVATEVGDFIAEKQRLVDIFTREHIKYISDSVRNKNTIEKNFHYLNERAKLYFPDYFALTILDKELKPVIDDFDGLISDLCLQDTSKALNFREYTTRIHPNPVAYHFDIVSPWQTKKTKGVFLISFHADFLGRLLKGRQIPGHKLLLVNKQSSNLIEVTVGGARVHLLREDYRLHSEELENVLILIPVRNTRWYVYTMHDTDLFNDEINNTIIEALIIFLAFAIMVAMSIWRLYREATRRQQAEQAKNEFISLMNHELRTPLTAIRGGLGLIASGVTSKMEGKTIQLAKLALNNAEHLGQLVDDFLDMQKLSSGKLEYHKEKVNIRPLVEHALEHYKSYADEFGVTFNLFPQSYDCEILADPHRIEQVMANLLSNAAKYGKDNDNIEILLERRADKVRISITDHGKGIPEDFQDRLFKAFEQSGNKREHVIKGTGLGLYIAKAIVQEHGGEIGFDTEKDRGTCFWFELPVVL
jgi:signal transduction histidine kinase